MLSKSDSHQSFEQRQGNMKNANMRRKAPRWLVALNMLGSLLIIAGLMSASTIQVTSQTEDTSPPQVLAFDFTPKSIDTSAGPQRVTCTWRVTDDLAGVSSVALVLLSPSGQQSINIGGNLISGSALDGLYQGSEELPQYSEMGTWFVSYIQVSDRVGNYRSLYEQDLINLGFPTKLEVTSQTEDVSPPQLLAFDFTPKSIDTSAGPQRVTCTWRVTDDLAGVSSVALGLLSPSGQQNKWIGGGLISGSALDGIWQGSSELPQYSEMGTWYVYYIQVSDRVGNYRYLSEQDLINLGFPTKLEVAVQTEDVTPPQLLAFDFTPKSIDTSAGPQTVTWTLRVTDDLAGVSYFVLGLLSPSGQQNKWIGGGLISGSALDGIWQGSYELPQYGEMGTWYVYWVQVSDRVGNYRALYEQDLINLGFPTKLDVASIPSDTQAPQLLAFDFTPKSIDTSAGPQTVTCTWRVTDDLAGVNFVGVLLQSPSGQQNKWIGGGLISGSALDGIYQGSSELPQYSEMGTWFVSYIQVSDRVGNYRTLYEQDLINLGFPTKLEVAVQTEDVTPPQLLAFDFTPKSIDTSAGHQRVTCTWRVTDDLAGVNFVGVLLQSPSGQQSISMGGSLISGSVLDGIYQGSSELPQYSEMGMWYVYRVQVSDRVGNYRSLYEQDLINLGFPTKLDVTSIPSDTQAPQVLAFDFTPKSIDTSAGPQTVTCTWRVTDDLAGVNFVGVLLQSPSGQQNKWIGGGLISGSALDGIYQGSSELPQYSEMGTWFVSYILLGDRVGNYRALYEQDLINLGFPTKLEVAVQTEDVTPPQLLAFDFTPKSIDTSAGPQRVTCTWRVTDDLAGVSSVALVLLSPSGQQSINIGGNLISGNALDGLYQGSEELPQYSEMGTWYVYRVQVSDRVGNYRSLYEQDLINLGFPTKLEVAVQAVVSGIILSPSSGTVGSSVTVIATGFAPSAILTTKFDGTPMTTNPATMTTNPTGDVYFMVLIPVAIAGTHTISVSDGVNTSTAAFTVRQKVVITSPTTKMGPVGTSVTVVGTGFSGAGVMAEVTIGGAWLAYVIPDNMGSFTATGTVPSSLAPGTYILLAADGAGYSATTAFTVLSAPDLVVSNITVPLTAMVGEQIQVTWTVTNTGTEIVNGSWVDRVLLSRDNSLGDDTFLTSLAYNGSVDTGGSYSQSRSISLPSVTGQYYILVVTDVYQTLPEALETNNWAASQGPMEIQVPYHATVETDTDHAPNGTSIPIHGHAYKTSDGTPASNEPVTIRILCKGMRRVLPVTTDANGDFQASFVPLQFEAGQYYLAADHPAVAEDTIQDQFVLVGMKADPSQLSVRMVPGLAVSGHIVIRNLSDIPLTMLAVSALNLPVNLTAEASVPQVLPGDGTVELEYTLNAIDASLAHGGIILHVTTAEGATLDVPMNITIVPLVSQLTANPGYLKSGMVRGNQTILSFEVINGGGAPSGDLQIMLPDFPWMSLAVDSTIPSIIPGQKVIVTIVLSPPADLPLGRYTGVIALQGKDGSLPVGFEFICVTDAVGDLRVTVVDNYTFYVAGEPKVEGARVILRDPYDNSIVVAEGVTDASGITLLSGVPEGTYLLEVSAENHGTSHSICTILPVIINDVQIFIGRELITYRWVVVPTEIEDQYNIRLESTFETNVPVPVVTIDVPKEMPDLAPGESTQIDVTVTNHGLIAALDVELDIPQHIDFAFEALVTKIGTLPARSAVTIPVTVERKQPASQQTSLSTMSAETGLASTTPMDNLDDYYPPQQLQSNHCIVFLGVLWDYYCGPTRVWERTTSGIPILANVCPAQAIIDSLPQLGGWGPSGGSGPYGTFNRPGTVDNSCDPCMGASIQALGCEALAGLSALIGHPMDWINCLLNSKDCLVRITNSNDKTIEELMPCVDAGFSCAQAAGKDIAKPISFIYDTVRCVQDYFNSCNEALQEGFHTLPEGLRLSDAELKLWLRAARVQRILDAYDGLYGGDAWEQVSDGQALADWLGAFRAREQTSSDAGARISDQERNELLNMAIPAPVTVDDINRFIDRWNRSIDYWSAGIFNLSDVPTGQSTDFIAVDVRLAELNAAEEAVQASEAEGFPDLLLALKDAKDKVVEWLGGENGVCAKVKMQIDQKAVMTRTAFLGTLQINNGNTTTTIEGVRVDLDIRDGNGTAANDKFGISGPELSGLTAVDGTGSIAAGGKGVAKYTFIPNWEAAPIEPTIYRIGGTLRYLAPGSGEEVIAPLFPSTVTVYPDALLELDYFMQRDVIGDDPFTEEIEPSEPFTLGLVVHNVGHGIAKNLRITSAQPKIIENEKGLLIDFHIIGAQVGAQDMMPSLTADFGNIDPGNAQEARWLLTSSLEGRFVDYSATFEHVTGLGDPRLSLIDNVRIHELIHTVRADRPGDDTLYDFLVNDEPDANYLPDTLYLSDGSVAVVNVGEATVDHPASLSDLEVHLTASMTSGWCYVRLPDPGPQLHLSRIVRSDGKEIRIGDNAWETDHVFAETDQSYHHENRLHLLDYDSTGSYTLFYSENVAPIVEAGPDATINEGRTFISSGYFVDPNADTWTATVDYGDGTGLYNLAFNVDKTLNLSHTYVNNGVYTVTVAVIDGEGAIGSDTANVTVSYTGPTANFSASPISGNEPLTVAFTDLSTSYDGITSWSWNFGDGNTSIEQNPSHQYSQEGDYTVSLAVSEADSDTDTEIKVEYITVSDTGPTADFSATPLSGNGPLIVAFTNLSTSYDGITSWTWNFGDGNSSTEQNPSHQYAQDGNYTVSLTVSEADADINTRTKLDYVTVIQPTDITSPAAVSDLAISSVLATSVTLSWTSPGDDGNIGNALQYDIRYSSSVITEANWGSATQCIGEPSPQPSGNTESFTVTGLSPGNTYYFSLKTADEVPNWSELSNVAACLRIPLKAGWNMVSVPVTPADNSVSAVFPGVAVVYTWDPVSKTYTVPGTVEPDIGYWVAVIQDATITVTGAPVETWTGSIAAGWNMIGSVISNASIADPDDSPGGSVQPFAYWWDPDTKTYVFTTEIQPGKGYWVAATQDCTLTVPGW